MRGQTASTTSGRPLTPSQMSIGTFLDAAVAELGEDPEPLHGALIAVARPAPEDLADALDGHGRGDVDGAIGDLAGADLHVDGVNRPGL